MKRKIISVLVICCFLPMVCFSSEPEFKYEYGGLEAMVVENVVQLYKDGVFLGEVSETGNGMEFNPSPEGIEIILCLYLLGDSLVGLVVCPLLPSCPNVSPAACLAVVTGCLVGIVSLMLLAYCVS